MAKIIFVDNSTRCFLLFRLPIAQKLIELGHKVYVLSPQTEENYLDQIKKAGCIHMSYSLGNKTSIVSDLNLLRKLFYLYKTIKADFIIHYTIKPNIYGSLASKLCGVPSLAIVPGTGSTLRRKDIMGKIIKLLYKLAFKYPTKIWVLNADDYNSFLKSKILSYDRIEILPGEGVDTSFYAPISIYNKKKPFIFLYMGRMLREKGVHLLAESAKNLYNKGYRNFEVHLLGLIDGLSDGVIPLKEIKSWEKNGVVKFLGSASDVRHYIDYSQCIVLPSFYGEGIPRSLMEASSMGRPILTTDNVGCKETVINGYNGLICRPNDIEDLTSVMEQFLNMEEEKLVQMGENGRLYIKEKYDIKKIVERYLYHIDKYL